MIARRVTGSPRLARGRLLLPAGLLPGLLALPAALPAREGGVWARSGPPAQVNVACLQAWTCHPRTAVLHGADTFVAVTPPKLVTGVCSAGGGAIDGCNVCLVSPPAASCEWELRKRP